MSSFLDRFPEARHITCDGSGGFERRPTTSGTAQAGIGFRKNGLDQPSTYPNAAPPPAGRMSDPNAFRRGLDQRSPPPPPAGRMSDPNAFRRGFDQRSPPPPRTSSPSYSGTGGMRPRFGDQGYGEMPPRGGLGSRDPDIVNGNNNGEEEENGEMTPEMLAQFIELCRQRLLANNDEGESQNNFMQLLTNILSQAHGGEPVRRRVVIPTVVFDHASGLVEWLQRLGESDLI
jgi:hypothetical protein